jgi:hypothetical protein
LIPKSTRLALRGTMQIASGYSSAGSIHLNGGTLTAESFSSALLAVPAEITVPEDISDSAFLVLGAAYTVDGIDFPAGTQFFKAADEYTAPGRHDASAGRPSHGHAGRNSHSQSDAVGYSPR